MNKRRYMTALLSASLLSLGACHQDSKQNNEKKDTITIAPKEVKKEHGESPEYPDTEIKCNLPEIEIKELVFAGKKYSTKDFKYGIAKYDDLLQFVSLSNTEIKDFFPFQPKSEELNDKTIRIDVRFSHNEGVGDKGQHFLPTAGNYDAHRLAKKLVYFYIFTKDKKYTFTSEKGGGNAEIIQVSKKGICGKLSFEDEKEKIIINAEFNLPNSALREGKVIRYQP